MAESAEQLAEPLAQLVVEDKSDNTVQSTSPESARTTEASGGASISETTASVAKQESALVLVDPALKAALLDGNRDTVLKLEQTVKQFLMDSRSSLEFPPSTSNFQRLLEHKVAQHHSLSTTTAFENGQPRVVAKKPPSGTEVPPAAQDLADIDVSTIKIEPKVLIKRPPAQQQHQHQQQHSNQHHQQRRKSHKEREQDYHEAREKLLGKTPLTAHGSSGRLNGQPTAPAADGNLQASLAGNRQPSPSATAGACYMAAVPPSVGERGFNIVNPGRGMGRGSGPGRGAPMPPAVAPPPAAAAAAPGSRVHGGVGPAPAAGPKAVYRDRERDVQDPDYRRGVDRYQQRFDPGFNAGGQQGGMYVVPTYGSEFPSLPGGQQQQQYGQGPPPPSSSSSSRRSPGYQQQRPNSSNGPCANPPAPPQQQQQDGSSNIANGNSSRRGSTGSAAGRPPPPPPGRTGSGNLSSSSSGGNHHQQQGSQQQQQQQYAAGYGPVMAYPGYDPNAAAMYGGYGYPPPGGWNPAAAAAMAYPYGGYGGAAGYGAGYMYPGYGYPQQQGVQWQGQGGQYGLPGQYGRQGQSHGGQGPDKGHARHNSSGSTGSKGGKGQQQQQQQQQGVSAAAAAVNGSAADGAQQ